MGRFGKFSGLEGCECNERFTCRQCLTLAGPTLAPPSPPTHMEWARKAGVATSCTAHHINYGGGCLNCGWTPARSAK